MRFAGIFSLLALVASVGAGCAASPSDCSLDAECRADEYCDVGLTGVKGYCRNVNDRPLEDGGPEEDAGVTEEDAGAPDRDGGADAGSDAGLRTDGGLRDGGADGGVDAGVPDAGAPDAGAPDAGTPDAGAPDAGTADTDTDGVPDSADNCPASFNPQQEDQDRDGVGDACDSCPSIANPRGAGGLQDASPCSPRAETEPNDTFVSATGITLPGVWSGAIDPAGDADTYVFAAEPGTYLRVAIDTTGGDLNAAVLVFGLDPANSGYRRVFDDPSRRDLARELFLGVGGRYAIVVTDARNALWRVGAPSFRYQMTLSMPFMPPGLPRFTSLPETRSDALAPFGAVRFYLLGLATPGTVRAEVTALRGGLSDLDALVTVYDPVTRKVLGENADQDDLTYDPRALARVPAGHDVLVVVEPESYAVLPGATPRAAFRLDLAAVPPVLELEPNDSVTTATPITLPATLSGVVDLEGPLSTQLGDRDLYRVEAPPGTLVRVRADPTGASLRAALTVLDPAGKVVAAHRDEAARFAVTETLITTSGDYAFVLDDRANADARAAGTGAFVGGAEYGYSLTAEVLAFSPIPLAAAPISVTVPMGGSAFLQYSLLPASGSGSLRLHCDDPRGGLDPWLRLYHHATFELLAEGPPPLEHFVDPSALLIGVSDAGGRGGGAFTCVVSASHVMTVAATAAESNDTRALASALAPPNAHALGALGSSSDVDWYKIRALFPGALTVYLQGQVAPSISVRLYDVDGRPLADASPAPSGIVGAKVMLLAHGTTKTGDLFLEVKSPSGATGNYTLVARVDGSCPAIPGTVKATGGVDAQTPPAMNSRSLWLTEVYAGPDQDANGDGALSNSQDEFVELYNPSTTVSLDLGGVSIRDAVTTNFTFPCGTVVAPRQAVVVFGGGRPAGDFGGSLVFAVEAASGLSLNNDSETLTILDPAGNAIDRFVWTSPTPCGFASATRYSCALDVDNSADALIRQNLIPGASGTFTAGRKPNGSLYAGGAAAPPGDLCASAPAVAVDLSTSTSLSIDASRASDNYTASCGLPGKEVVFRLAPESAVSVDLFPSVGVRSLSIRMACDASAAEVSGGCAVGPLSIDSLQPLPTGQSYGLFVEADGDAAVRAEFGPPRGVSTNIDCNTPIDLSSTGSGTTHRGNTRAGGRPYDTACSAEIDEEPALWYQFSLPAPRRVRIVATASWGPVVTLLSACGGRVLACGEPALDLPTLPAGNYRFAVSGRGPHDGDSGAYDVLLAIEAPVSAPARDQCESATPASGALGSESNVGASDHYTPPRDGACGALPEAMPGPDLLYPIVVPAGLTLTATATPATGSGLDLALYLLSSCREIGRCLAAADAFGVAGAESVSYRNAEASEVTVYLVIDSRVSAARGLFDLDVRTQ